MLKTKKYQIGITVFCLLVILLLAVLNEYWGNPLIAEEAVKQIEDSSFSYGLSRFFATGLHRTVCFLFGGFIFGAWLPSIMSWWSNKNKQA